MSCRTAESSVTGTVPKKTKTLVAYGRTVTLAAGDYLALFKFKVQPSDQPERDHNGVLRINERKTQTVLARVEILSGPDPICPHCSGE